MAPSLASYMQQLFHHLARLPLLPFTLFRDYALRSSDPTLITAGVNDACRYRLDNKTSATLTLPDGRKLGYARYGSQTGPTVFYLHGTPGSRIEAASLDKIAERLGFRIVSIDRPGMGWSTPHPNRTLLDHTKDIECLALHLELESYGVLGISGGGPYALACAASLPADKLKVVTVVCGLGPPDMGDAGMNWSNWIGFRFLHRRVPGFVQWWVHNDPGPRLDLSDEERLRRSIRNAEKMKSSKADPKDVAVLSDTDRTRLFLSTSRNTFAQGLDGYTSDGALIGMDFGFRIEDIRPDLPIQLWYGKRDTWVPPTHGEQTAARLGPRACLRMEDETHLSIVTEWEDEILSDLVKVLKS